jgi:hypothetical protein
MTIAELAETVNELKETVLQFISTQVEYNKQICKHETDLRGNGKEGVLTTLALIDGRVKQVEKIDERRKKIVDGLVASFALLAFLEVVKLIAEAIK